MAENDNTGTAAPDKDLVAAVATLLLESRIAIEAARIGLERLAADYPSIENELLVVTRFAIQAGEAFEALTQALTQLLPLRGLQA